MTLAQTQNDFLRLTLLNSKKFRCGKKSVLADERTVDAATAFPRTTSGAWLIPANHAPAAAIAITTTSFFMSRK